MSENTFFYTYSARENAEIKQIRDKYIDKPISEFDKLKSLDKKVQMSGQIEGLSVGVIGSLVFGIGMCFGLGVFEKSMILAIVLSFIGVGISLAAWPLYKKIHKKAYDKYVPEILKLTKNLEK